MASGTYSNMVIDPVAYHDGVFEGMAQNIAAFNALSRGCIRLERRDLPGHYHSEVMFKSLEDAVTRRDITSSSAVSSGDVNPIAEIAEIGIKLNRKVVLENTVDSFQKSIQSRFGGDPSQWSQAIGEEVGKAKLKRQLNDALRGVTAALLGQSDVKFTVATSGTMQKESINSGMAKFGDMAARLRSEGVAVMHSKPFHDLIGDQVADNIVDVTGAVLYGGIPATYGIPTLVIDSPALSATTGSGTAQVTDYYTLLLVPDAVKVTDSEEDRMHVILTSAENVMARLQGEFAHNVQCKGFAWDNTNGGINPTDAALATTTNWDKVATSHKNLAGVVIQSR